MRRIRITLPRKKIEEFCLNWKISEMALFGSVLSDEFRSDSDIDVLVSFKDDAGWGLFEFVDCQDSQFQDDQLSAQAKNIALVYCGHTAVTVHFALNDMAL